MSPYRPFVARLFDAPAERIIALGRVVLALSALAAFAVHGEGTTHNDELTSLLLFAYLVFALGVLAWDRFWGFGDSFPQVVHGLDIAVASAILLLTNGPVSPYFVLCVFVLLAAALRWDWRGPLLSALLLGAVLVGSYFAGLGGAGDAFELNRLIVRASFLAVGGVMLSYSAAYRQRSRERLARLANWPASRPQAEPTSLEPALAHAAHVLEVPAVLVVWEQPQEPSLHLLSWRDGEVRYSRERRSLFGDLVPRAYADHAVVCGGFLGAGLPEINKELRKAFAIDNAATAPFSTDVCSGRVFLINRPAWSAEELALTEIVASRIGVKIQELILRQEVEGAATAKERERLGRDLHDGLLQGLAAATMQLRAMTEGLPQASKSELDSVRGIITEEAQKIRRFVEETRDRPAAATGVVKLASEITGVIESSRRRWGCEVDLTINPPHLECSLSAAWSIRHMLNEAISNAVRHGRALRVEAEIRSRDDHVVLSIQDDGIGFVDLDGSYTQKQLKSGNRGPLSLRSRVEELGGVLYLTSTPTGANVTVEFPL
jgi:signal transduction histidine kinase